MRRGSWPMAYKLLQARLPARPPQKQNHTTTDHRNQRRSTSTCPCTCHLHLDQSFLGRTLIQGLYICEDSQTTASRSATTGGCPPMLKLFMIGNQNQKSKKSMPMLQPIPNSCSSYSPFPLATGSHTPRSRWLGVGIIHAHRHIAHPCDHT